MRAGPQVGSSLLTQHQGPALAGWFLGVGFHGSGVGSKVLAEDRILRLTPHEVNQLERALDYEPEVVPQLRALIRRFSIDREAASTEPWHSLNGDPSRPGRL